MTTLILPVAGQSSRYANTLPKWLLNMPSGKMMIEEAVELMDLGKYERIVVIALKDHIDRYAEAQSLQDRFRQKISQSVELCLLEQATSCQAETIAKGIEKSNITGPFVIKDCDNKFSIDISNGNNQVAYVDMHSIEMAEARGKSYINIDDIGRIDNIVEKRIISNYFCCGAYGFESAETFLKYAMQLLSMSEDVYISHVILQMLLNKEVFYAREADNYVDWGTLSEFQDWQRKHLTIICNIDGCLIERGKSIVDPIKNRLIEKNLASLLKFKDKPHVKVILLSSREESERHLIMDFLDSNGLNVHSLIMGLPESRQVLINDFSNSKLFPSSISVNLESNSAELESILNALHR